MALLSSLGWIVVALTGVYGRGQEWGSGENRVSQLPSVYYPNAVLPDQQLPTWPLSLASVYSLLLHCLQPSHQVARQHLPPEFYLRCGYVSQPLTSEGLRL